MACVPHVSKPWPKPIRDFTNVQVDDNTGHFEFLSLENDRAAVVFILEGKVSHVIYYDALNGGSIVVEINGQTIHP